MTFAIYKGEKNVTELAARLFRLRGAGSQPAAKEAADALLKANPQLKEINKVPVGSVVVVPPEAPPLHQEESPAPADMVRAFAAERAQQYLATLNTRLSDFESQAGDATNEILAIAKSRDVKAAAANSPNLEQSLPAIIKAAESRLKDIKSSQDSRTKTVAELRKGLAEFLGK